MKWIVPLCWFICVQSMLSAQIQEVPKVSSGKIVRWAQWPSAFVEARNVDIWLPPEYDANPTSTFPVLYFQDGQNLFDASLSYGGVEWGLDEWMAKLIAEKRIKPAIVVGIWNSPKRFREYMPEEPFYTLEDSIRNALSTERGGVPVSKQYLRFLVEELIPRVDREFRTQANRESRFLAGSSMGGLISMYTLVKNPDLFSAAACISTHWPSSLKFNTGEIPASIQKWMEENIPVNPNYRMYFDHGTTQLDAWYPQWQKQVDAMLSQKKFKPGTLISKTFEGAGHNEASWNARLDIILEFLLSQSKP